MLKNKENLKDMITFADVKLLGDTMNTEPDLKPYTIEELQARIVESERQYAVGMWQEFDEAIDEIEAELDAEESKSKMAEAI